ncbi:MAG: GAF domain-containing protein [Longimicrobiales bacterium]
MIDTTDLVKEIQEMREDGFLSDALVRFAVRTLKEGDERFDWVGAYLFNEKDNELWLHNYLGPRTEVAKIQPGEGVAGVAAAEKANKYVPHVDEMTDYEAPGPNTASELAVIIRAGDDLFGLLDIASMEPEAFSAEDEGAISLVADKLAEQFMAERR